MNSGTSKAFNWKKYATAVLYASQNPILVWAGYALGVNDWLLAAALVVVLMIMEGGAVKLWMEAQTVESKEAAK